MNKFDGFLRTVKMTVSKHSPEILTGVGIAGMIGTSIIAVKATPKALKLIEAKKKELEVEKLTVIDTVKVTWKCYLPAAITGVTSTACLIGASSVNARRNAALMTAYNISRTAMTEYKDKVVESIGDKKEKLIRDEIVKEKVDKDQGYNREIIMTGKDTTLCYDVMFGRWFRSDLDTIIRAVNEINRKIVTGTFDMYASLNDFYDELGLPPVEAGDYLGWNIDDGDIEIDKHPGLTDKGEPYLGIGFNKPPHYGYSKNF